MLVKLLGIEIDNRPLQPLKAHPQILNVPDFTEMLWGHGVPLYVESKLLIDITPSDLFGDHGVPEKAEPPILGAELGMVMLVRPDHP